MPFAVYVLGLGIFAMTTSEFMVSGLMPSLAAEFAVSVAAIGYLISAFAAAMVVGGPVLAVGLLRMPRKRALLVLIGVFLVGQALGAIATGYAVMLVARVITGVASSAFFGVAIAVAVELVGPQRRGRASAVVLGGVMFGTVLGLPATTLVDQLYGWRASFWAVALATLVAGLVVFRVVPSGARPEGMSLRDELAALRNGRLWAAYATSGLLVGGVFAAFSYFSPIFIEVSGFSPAVVPVLLTAYGAATVVGNTVVGRFADRHATPILTFGLGALVVTLAGFALFAGSRPMTVVAVVVLGLVGVSMVPALGVRVMRVADGRPLVNTVHTSVISFGIGLGSWAGGLGISAGLSLTSPLWVGASFAVLGLVSLIAARSGAPERLPVSVG
ncbi:MFS transporter [Allokutzneria albata]|uniref:Predicted arabinose efflux permease, MFS family n=1 Tax=Allokutzneria albata TaxID=211114 RepID=A0A1G9TIN2_ALLAB|nr:MFS transporter [Allokutzneria albata]SDM47607.1 Predicted arabinose efflux permease, MFS family [Allokutzneria albata]